MVVHLFAKPLNFIDPGWDKKVWDQQALALQNFLQSRTVNRLNLGAGSDIRQPEEEWINVDGLPLPKVDVVADVSKLDMFGDECADEIYASHVLEHMKYTESLAVIQEWVRLLKVGGKMVVEVPDLGALAHFYVRGEWQIGPPGSERNLQNCVYGNFESDDVFGFHKAAFDQNLMRHYLRQAGLMDIQVGPSRRGHAFELYAEGAKADL